MSKTDLSRISVVCLAQILNLMIFREYLINKEKMESICRGNYKPEIYLHKHSIFDDLESFNRYLRLGRKQKACVNFGGSYFLPKLTNQERRLVEINDRNYLDSFNQFASGENPNFDPYEDDNKMKPSESKSRFIHCSGWRSTYLAEIKKNKMYRWTMYVDGVGRETLVYPMKNLKLTKNQLIQLYGRNWKRKRLDPNKYYLYP